MAARLGDWVDQPVDVEFVAREGDRTPQQTRYTLEGTDRGGILLGYAPESDLNDHRILFFPWHRIEHIHLLQ